MNVLKVAVEIPVKLIFLLVSLNNRVKESGTIVSLLQKRVGTKIFQFLKILIIKPFKSIIKCEKRTKQNSDYRKTSFVRFLYLRSDFCPSLLFLFFFYKNQFFIIWKIRSIVKTCKRKLFDLLKIIDLGFHQSSQKLPTRLFRNSRMTFEFASLFF